MQVYGWEIFPVSRHAARLDGHGHCVCGDTNTMPIVLVCHLTTSYKDHVTLWIGAPQDKDGYRGSEDIIFLVCHMTTLSKNM